MLGLAFSLWPNESLNVSCKVKQIWQEGLIAPAMASQSGAAGRQSSSKNGSISQLWHGCCDPALHRGAQVGEKTTWGIPTLSLCPAKEGCLIPGEGLTLAPVELWKAPQRVDLCA